MHGTHVAGIAGAVGNNGIGIAGAAWNVKLMHIKVFQSTGQGNTTTIADGIEYASSNGATIINMSFGSYAESSTLRLALENAYATSVLVAAAGNDKVAIGPCSVCLPFYPAAYPYVLGVEDNANYSNYDQDGPIFSGYDNFLNYELTAPGTGIMSTIPGGGYNTLTGTSMSAPLVAGAMALYYQIKPDDSKELLFGNLINTSSTYIDFLAAIEIVPTPKLAVLSTIERDTINSQNGNGFFEPGETIEILPLIKNYWGPTEDVRVGIEFDEFEDTSKATIIENEIEIGSISAYATLQDLTKSLKIQIAEGVANNVDIKFNLTVWSGPDQEYMSEPIEFVLNVKNSILLFGVKSDQVVLTPDKEYLVSANLALVNDADYTIMPGTIIKISNGVKILIKDNAKLSANGTKDSRIIFQAEDNSWSGIKSTSNNFVTFDYTEFRSAYQNQVPIFEGNNFSTISNSLFIDCFSFDGLSNNFNISDSNIIENNFMNHIINIGQNKVTNTVIADNNTSGLYGGVSVMNNTDFTDSNNLNILNNQFNMNASSTESTINIPSSIYFGSLREDIIRTKLIDFLVNINSRGILNTDNVSESALASTKGIVWKVEVNGKDAQDEYDLMDPIGVGSHEFKIYFNREMDTSFDPQISYGVTIPYNQKIITDQGTWSADGKVYTVIHDINIGAADGINRIRVQDAQDLDYFKIPVEDSRFNFLLQSAGSASTGWFATAGLGNIALEWTAPSSDDLSDVLGYNMYRYQVDEDGVESDPVKLNDSLIIEDTDESTTGVYFTDYEVVEGQTYFYKYKILRTNFEETDYSNAVSSSPLTSTLGDSNGDFAVNVLDLVHDVDYILGNNPEPFIFVAGDVNADNTINVLDIVGTVDIILNPSSDSDSSVGSNDIQFYPSEAIGTANFTWEGNDLYVESNFDIGGIQLAFNTDFEYVLSDNLPSIESLDYTQEDSKILMLYSFNNTVIASSKTKILTRIDASQEFDIEQAVVGTISGAKLNAVLNNGTLSTIEAPFQNNKLQFLNLFPNPAEGLVHLEYYLPNQMDQVIAKVYDLLGRLVHLELLENKEGISKSTIALDSLKSGNYIVLITANKGGAIKNIANKKLIIK